jgi:hypothetical protein
VKNGERDKRRDEQSEKSLLPRAPFTYQTTTEDTTENTTQVVCSKRGWKKKKVNIEATHTTVTHRTQNIVLKSTNTNRIL